MRRQFRHKGNLIPEVVVLTIANFHVLSLVIFNPS